MDSEEIKLLLVKYITGQANAAEVNEVKQWIKLHPENELYFVELYEAWQNMLYVNPAVIDDEKAYDLFLARLSPEEELPPRRPWMRYAAAIVLLLVSAVAVIHYFPVKPETDSSLIAEKGAIKKITLKDGTLVWLNAGSTINYDEGFGSTDRTVYLEGEAFFDIAHGKNTIPFIVNTKNYMVRDIGTRFNLKAYANDPFFETTVVNGEVAVQRNAPAGQQDNNRIYVKPHQVLKIYYSSDRPAAGEKLIAAKASAFNVVQVSQVDSAKLGLYDGWKEDLLIFDDSSLGEMAKILERRYNVKITLDDSELRDIRYSGSFKSVASIDKVLQIIKQNTPISYTIDGQNITITKN